MSHTFQRPMGVPQPPSPEERILADVAAIDSDEFAWLRLRTWRTQARTDRQYEVREKWLDSGPHVRVTLRDQVEDRTVEGWGPDLSRAVTLAFLRLEEQPLPAECEPIDDSAIDMMVDSIMDAVSRICAFEDAAHNAIRAGAEEGLQEYLAGFDGWLREREVSR